MTYHPSDLAPVFRRAAEIIRTNGLYQGDYIPAPFSRVLRALPHERPMSAVAALRCAETGSPQRYGPLSAAAIAFLADRLLVDGEPPFYRDELTLECHVAAWGDVRGRMAGEVVAELLRAAEAIEAGQHAAVIPVGLVTSDGSCWELSGVPADGEPRYVPAGVDAPAFMFAGLGELVARFGAVSAGGAR